MFDATTSELQHYPDPTAPPVDTPNVLAELGELHLHRPHPDDPDQAVDAWLAHRDVVATHLTGAA